MFLKFARKAYSASQYILIDGKAFVVIVRHSQVFLTFAKDSQEIRQADRKLCKKFAGIRKEFGRIRDHLKGLTFSVILLGNRIISGEFAANIIFFTFARIFATVRE